MGRGHGFLRRQKEKKRLASLSNGRIRGASEPVDVFSPSSPHEGGDGIRTLFDALHHFEPREARRILEGAARAGVTGLKGMLPQGMLPRDSL